LIVASEATPWAKTGGLADVAGALPAALDQLGHTVTLVMPKYRDVATGAATPVAHRLRASHLSRDVAFHVLHVSPRHRVVFVECPALFDRPGLYGDRAGDYRDNAERFDTLSLAALDFVEINRDFPRVDVVHVHDWQTGLIPVRLRLDSLGSLWPSLAAAGVVLTVHNLAYQGLFPREVVPALGLPWTVFSMEAGEFWGQFSFLKTGLTSADYVTTVSPTYADETKTPALGAGLDGVLRALGRRYVGILNGIDTDVWNPGSDSLLPAHFDANDLAGKAECKRALLGHVGLSRGDDALARPLVGMVSRLVSQKGLDLIEAAGEELVELDATYVFLGSGDAKYERALMALQAAHPSRVAVHIGFDERLAHLIEAGADMFLMPSEFEPCGLNQMYSLRYGTVPIVRAVGGLDDTIQPYTANAKRANGFKFRTPTGTALAQIVRRAVRLYHNPPVWRRLMLNGMAADHSWTTPAREYVKVYRRARARRADRE